jgi:hypothetical protein
MRYVYDIHGLGEKCVNDMRLAQTADGLVPEIAPEFTVFDGSFRDSPEWGSSSIILPWYMYRWYGDKTILTDSYAMMQRYLAYLGGKADGHILSQGLGDWFDIGPKAPGVSQNTPMGITGTAIYHYDLLIAAKVAQLLGKSADAAGYTKLAGDVRSAFNRKFFNPQTKQYGTGSQTANAMAVYCGLVNASDRADVVANIVNDIRARNNTLTAGDIGYRYLLRVLEEAGHSDVIFEMNNRSDVPGYGYQLAKGATALTESWQALPNVSNNHLMLGHLMEWFFSGLCGIRQPDNESAVAFRTFDIRPDPVGDISWAKASTRSPYGTISSAWEKKNGKFLLDVEIPVNCTAAIYLPVPDHTAVKMNGTLVKSANRQDGRLVVAVGSGTYHFEADL